MTPPSMMQTTAPSTTSPAPSAPSVDAAASGGGVPAGAGDGGGNVASGGGAAVKVAARPLADGSSDDVSSPTHGPAVNVRSADVPSTPGVPAAPVVMSREMAAVPQGSRQLQPSATSPSPAPASSPPAKATTSTPAPSSPPPSQLQPFQQSATATTTTVDAAATTAATTAATIAATTAAATPAVTTTADPIAGTPASNAIVIPAPFAGAAAAAATAAAAAAATGTPISGNTGNTGNTAATTAVVTKEQATSLNLAPTDQNVLPSSSPTIVTSAPIPTGIATSSALPSEKSAPDVTPVTPSVFPAATTGPMATATATSSAPPLATTVPTVAETVASSALPLAKAAPTAAATMTTSALPSTHEQNTSTLPLSTSSPLAPSLPVANATAVTPQPTPVPAPVVNPTLVATTPSEQTPAVISAAVPVPSSSPILTPTATAYAPTLSPPADTPSSAEKEKKIRRTRTRLTVAQKVDVLRRLEKGERQSALAVEFGCSKRALARLKQERASFESIHLTEADAYRKSRHSVKHVLLEGKLTHFLRLAKRNSFPITGNSVRCAALKLRDDLLADPNLPDTERPALEAFQASINWSKGFLKRCGVRTVESKSEPLPVQQQIENKRKLEKRLMEFDLDCIFCVDRMLLFYKLLPNESFSQPSAARGELQPPDSARIKERVTLLLATSITGPVKIPPTIVGSEAVPQCFRQQPCKLPYLSHAYSWVDDATFKTWFYCVLVPAIRRGTSKRVAVVVDSDWAPTEVQDSHGQVELIAIPSELASDCHPMHAGILSVFRRSLRYSLLNRMIRVVGDAGVGAPDTGAMSQRAAGGREASVDARGAVMDMDITLLVLADLVEAAWNGLTDGLFTKCWVKSGLLPEEHSRRLISSYGAASATSDEQMFFSCCTATQIRAIRTLEDLIINRRLFAQNGGSLRARELVTSLHEAGRRGIEGWLDVECSPKAQRALTVELDRIIGEYKSPIAAACTPAKRTVSEMTGKAGAGGLNAAGGGDGVVGVAEQERVAEPLPHVGFMMELLAPVQKIVDECESGNAALLLGNLKHELVRVKSEQEKMSER